MWDRIILIPVFVVILLSAAKAQENTADPAPPAPAEQPATEPAPPAPAPVPPPPGPEVMRPTKHGLRMTPDLARAFGRAAAFGSRKDLKTTPEQEKQLGDRFARRLMELGRKHQREAQPALEYLLTKLLEHAGESGPGLKFTPEEAQEFAKRCSPLVAMAQETIDASVQEGDSILSPEQKELRAKKILEARNGIKHMDEVFRRWADGGYRDGDNPFEAEKQKPADGQEGTGAASAPSKPEMRQAEAVADAQMEQFGPAEWSRLLDAAKKAFAFDDAQKAKADRLLADYRAKADGIMTGEWKQAVRTNRIKSHLNNWLRDQPKRPFVFHIQQEYARLIKPVNDLGLAFRADLLALVTPEQRAAAVAEVQSTAGTVGLSMAAGDEALLGLAAGPTEATAGTP